MDMQEITERLDRLENKMKVNFFEIEKRFAKISPDSGNDDIDQLKDRLQELEDLQMYLELENMKLKEKIGDSSPFYSADIEERIKKLESQSGSHVVVHDKKVPESVMSQIEDIKEQLSRMGSSKELREAVNLIDKRMDAVESAVDQLGDLIKSSEQVSMTKSLEEVRRIRDEISSVVKTKEDVMGHLSQMSSEIDRVSVLINTMEELENKVQKDVAVMEDMKKSVYSGMDSHPHEAIEELSSRVTLLEEKLKSEIQQTQVIRSRINDLLNKIQLSTKIDIEDRLKRLERDMEMKAQEFLTENLKKFAKALDEKVPQLLSENYLTQKIVEAHTNLAPIQKQISNFSIRLDNIEKRMRGLHSSIPVVVE